MQSLPGIVEFVYACLSMEKFLESTIAMIWTGCFVRVVKMFMVRKQGRLYSVFLFLCIYAMRVEELSTACACYCPTVMAPVRALEA